MQRLPRWQHQGSPNDVWCRFEQLYGTVRQLNPHHVFRFAGEKKPHKVFRTIQEDADTEQIPVSHALRLDFKLIQM